MCRDQEKAKVESGGTATDCSIYLKNYLFVKFITLETPHNFVFIDVMILNFIADGKSVHEQAAVMMGGAGI